MTPIARRAFLRRAAAGLGALAGSSLLSACGVCPASTPILPSPTSGQTVPPGGTAAATEAAPADATPAPASALPDLVVARGGDPPEMVRRALAALGGIERFVRPGANVIVKPNICVAYHSYEYAATTNPWVVGALVQLCLEAGASRVGMKNLMGVIRDRPAMHRNLGQRIADLTSRVRPTLTVVDAVRMLMANGPTGGSLDDVQPMDTVIASPDIVAADSYAATLFGRQPDDLEYLRAGAAMGLGRSDLDNLRIEEITVGG